MTVFQTSDPAEAMQFAADCLSEHKEGFDVFFNKETFLQTGRTETSDVSKAKELGIPVWTAEHKGGSIVCFDGDLSLCLLKRGNNSYGFEWMNVCARLLEKAGADVGFDGNDLLADGKKVASWASAALPNGWMQTVAHFSVSIDIEIVKMLCTKPMLKVPGALSEYGIDAEMIWNAISSEMQIQRVVKDGDS